VQLRRAYHSAGLGRGLIAVARIKRNPQLYRAAKHALTWTNDGADDGIRTRDPHLGKV